MIGIHSMRSCAVIFLCVFLTACASGYSEFYRPASGLSPELLSKLRVAPAPKDPAVERVQHPGENYSTFLDSYARRGFILIGVSSFSSGSPQNDGDAVEQGRKIGADLVVVFEPKFAGTTTSAVPITTPTTTTIYSSGSATAYGVGGPVSAYGSGTTTVYGSRTTVVPVTVHRNDFGAGYFVRRKWQFGVIGRELSDSERQTLQTNKGLYVRVVVDGSPAYQSDILPGDIILSVNGEIFSSSKEFSGLIEKFVGGAADFEISRNGNRVTKNVFLGR